MSLGKKILGWFFIIITILFISSLFREDKSEELTINDIITVLDNFESLYKVISVDDFSYGKNSLIIRKSIKISVPPGLSRQSLQDNIKHAALSIYNTYTPDGISVYAYKEGTDSQGIYSAGHGVFAPNGNWEEIAPFAPLKKYKFNIELKDSYFN